MCDTFWEVASVSKTDSQPGSDSHEDSDANLNSDPNSGQNSDPKVDSEFEGLFIKVNQRTPVKIIKM